MLSAPAPLRRAPAPLHPAPATLPSRHGASSLAASRFSPSRSCSFPAAVAAVAAGKKAVTKASTKAGTKVLEWPDEALPVFSDEEEGKLWKLMQKSYFNFRELDVNEIDDMLSSLQELMRPGSALPAGMVMSMRRQIQFNAAVLRSPCLKKEDCLEKLATRSAELRQREELCAPVLSRELSLPPTTILNRVLSEMDLQGATLPKLWALLDAARLERPFTDAWEDEAQEVVKEAVTAPLDPWVLREVMWTMENDGEARQQSSGRMATAFEDGLVQFCRDSGLSVQTEADLQAQGGQATPDLLFDSPVHLHHRKADVRWMECKSYYGSDRNFVFRRKLLKQAKRFTKAFGAGALVFRQGASAPIVEKLQRQVPGLVILDGSGLCLDASVQVPQFVAGPKAEFWEFRTYPEPATKKKSNKNKKKRKQKQKKAVKGDEAQKG